MSETAMLDARFAGRVGGFVLDAAFRVPAVGVTAVVGPSGSGKTTLLRCIAGLTRLPGRLRLAEIVWQDDRLFLPTHRRALGYVFQEPSLLANLSVRENLMFGLRRARDRSRIGFDAVVELISLSALIDRAPHQLSGGERQRVAIGRALLSQPDLLLMDEPLSSLDPEGKAEILSHLDRLHRTLAIPVIYVSHDQAEVARLADRVLAMDGGRISGPGAPEDFGARLAEMDEAQVRGLAAAALAAGLTPLG